MIDLHCHVLPGVDDGPREIEESVELARAAAAAGITKIVATPHVSWTYDNRAADIAERVAMLNTVLREREVPIEVLPGAEVAISRAVELDDRELRALTLGGGPWLLAEPPFTPGAVGLAAMIHSLRARGHQLVIAHPERCPGYLQDRAALETLVADGVLTSVTAGALVGRFGKHSKAFAEGLLRSGMAHNVASDAHNTRRRAPGMAQELAAAGFKDSIDWLCNAVPAALVAGTPLPDGPPPPPKRGPLTRLLRS